MVLYYLLPIDQRSLTQCISDWIVPYLYSKGLQRTPQVNHRFYNFFKINGYRPPINIEKLIFFCYLVKCTISYFITRPEIINTIYL